MRLLHEEALRMKSKYLKGWHANGENRAKCPIWRKVLNFQ